ncbi:protein ALP1-like [Megalobrama amblycephala]|uniref:protein ALP1-like n=1 Tax=Megalobrama amblycephala TaxID=75352 RepID=UPI0020147E69|nr:protein ALP1-like [Megalobrama amblycephala]
MANNNKQLAIQVICALICSEKEKKKKKRIWRREYLKRRGQQGVSVPQRVLELNDETGCRELLRMTAEEFEFLLGMVGALITKQHTKMRRAISPRDRLSVTLRYLASGETFSSLSLQYRIGASTISQIVMETCAALHQVMKKDFLKMPSTEAEWQTVAHDFESKWQFPHCLGVLGGKRIYLQPPAKTGSLDHNYKGRFSVTIMAAVDANSKFIYASVGTQGRVSDAGLFAHSDLCKAMDQGSLNFPPPKQLPNSDVKMPYMFVGDEAYPLRPDLMTPYPCKQTDRSQRVLNYRLSRARRVAENAFGILANRLRVFRNTIFLEPDKVVKITMASLCIHNFLRERRSEAYTPPAFADWENEDHSLVEGTWRNQGTGSFQPVEQRSESSVSVTAESQRNLLCDYFVSPAGCVPWQEEHI